MKMLKKEILRAGGHEYDILAHKKEVQTMDDRQLVDHRNELISNHKGAKMSSDEYWSRMWTVNAEMAARFCRRVGK